MVERKKNIRKGEITEMINRVFALPSLSEIGSRDECSGGSGQLKYSQRCIGEKEGFTLAVLRM